MAFDADPANAARKVAYARNLPYERKTEAIAMLREAAAQGSAEARTTRSRRQMGAPRHPGYGASD
jgi:hypothetical protein